MESHKKIALIKSAVPNIYAVKKYPELKDFFDFIENAGKLTVKQAVSLALHFYGFQEFTRDEIAQWVAALRSGQYAQTRGTLKNEEGYCCLGVASSVLYREPSTARDAEDTGEPDIYSYIHSKLPPKLGYELAEKNDRGCTFNEIADYIEDFYEQH